MRGDQKGVHPRRIATLLVLALVVLVAPAARADEPPSYGHRIGLSQYGAAARAAAGHDASRILDFYYPGTTPLVTGPAWVRVWFYDRPEVAVKSGRGVAKGGTRFTSVGGLLVRDGVATGSAMAAIDGPFCLRSCYRGRLLLRARPDGTVRAVNRVGMEAYLRSVVPSEMVSSWPTEGLRAQAIAARSYAWSNMRPDRDWDVYQDTRSQAYWGIPSETALTDAAVSSTFRTVRTWEDAPILAMYTAANGGTTKAYPGYAYLQARRDPFDAIGRRDLSEGGTRSLRARREP